MPNDESESTIEYCPVCGEPVNHRIRNGYRNSWPLGVLDDDQQLVVCTPDDSDDVFVHVEVKDDAE